MKPADAARRVRILEDLMDVRDAKPDIAEICATIVEERFEDGCMHAPLKGTLPTTVNECVHIHS